ncbi:molybdenum cofactor guanylyltransferase MobA [Rhizobium sp. FY34]|uniref:molybdenum cofactor guanylyltransferase MobA n=1 Tax=Rhizobium sp. FY34 TaxID=2562309 RepID=UPI0010BF6A1D|nr:molybdenum cofactor guanylyltransferase MobA [Rhizobium sp. FY34]
MTGMPLIIPPAVILAGGLSRRMGRDKAQIVLGGRSLLDHVIARIKPQVSTLALNAPLDHPVSQGLPLVPDSLPGRPGPLAGILAAMQHAARQVPQASHVLTVPIDSPFLPHNLVEKLAQSVTTDNVIAIATSQGAMHPVCGLWPISLASALQDFLDGPDEPRVKTFLSRHNTVLVAFADIDTPVGPLDPFLNLNTPEDLENARRFVEAGA